MTVVLLLFVFVQNQSALTLKITSVPSGFSQQVLKIITQHP